MRKSGNSLPVFYLKRCASCDICIDVCPVDCLVRTLPFQFRSGRRYPYLPVPERCTGCGRCAEECPLDAIRMAP